jgi:vacuolar protein sorting-associated protein 11
MNYLDNKF